MQLNQIRDNKGARVRRVRRGRGIGSGLGKTAGHGQKGQKARTGVSINGFEGGQMPLHRRLPKRGFKSHFKTNYAIVNLCRIQRAIDAQDISIKDKITYDTLVKAGLIRDGFKGVRLLASGDFSSKIEIEVASYSLKAKERVEALGGKVYSEAPAVLSETKESKKPVSKSAKKEINEKTE
ncbi:MAG: 50S ribosomal protein L15 [Proteobacteria bacterium]|nr:50S ribosomal protein L15 [Pseudomonadota bacterium]